MKQKVLGALVLSSGADGCTVPRRAEDCLRTLYDKINILNSFCVQARNINNLPCFIHLLMLMWLIDYFIVILCTTHHRGCSLSCEMILESGKMTWTFFSITFAVKITHCGPLITQNVFVKEEKIRHMV